MRANASLGLRTAYLLLQSRGQDLYRTYQSNPHISSAITWDSLHQTSKNALMVVVHALNFLTKMTRHSASRGVTDWRRKRSIWANQPYLKLAVEYMAQTRPRPSPPWINGTPACPLPPRPWESARPLLLHWDELSNPW